MAGENFAQNVGLGMRLVEGAQQMRMNALNMTQKLMQMDQQAQTFPLEMQQLNNRNQIESLNIQAANEAMTAKHADDLILAQWHKEHPNMTDILSDPPPVTGLEAQKNVVNMQTIVGQTWSVLQKKKDMVYSDPAVMALVEQRRAAAALSSAKEDLTIAQQHAVESGKGRSYAPTAGIKEAQYADQLEAQATAAEDAGDNETASKLRAQASAFRAKLDKSAGKAPLTIAQRISLEAHVASLAKQMADMDKSSDEYKTVSQLLKEAQRELRGENATPALSPKIEPPPVVNPKDPGDLLRFYK